jgi:hypothetical protein
MSLDVLKYLLGLIGSILAIVPFMRDFAQRQKIRRWKDFSRLPIFRRRTEEIATREGAKLREPERRRHTICHGRDIAANREFCAQSLYQPTQSAALRAPA